MLRFLQVYFDRAGIDLGVSVALLLQPVEDRGSDAGPALLTPVSLPCQPDAFITLGMETAIQLGLISLFACHNT